MSVEVDFRPQEKEAAYNAGLSGAGNDQSGSVTNPFDTFVESLAPGEYHGRPYPSEVYANVSDLILTMLDDHPPNWESPIDIETKDNIQMVWYASQFVFYERVSGRKQAGWQDHLYYNLVDEELSLDEPQNPTWRVFRDRMEFTYSRQR